MKTVIITSRINGFFLFLLFFLLVGCKSDQEKKEEVKEFIQIFVQDIKLKNSEKVKLSYPAIVKIGEYWIPHEFVVTDVAKNEGLYSVYGKYKFKNQIEKQLMFEVKEAGGAYKIIATKGLSVFSDGPLNDFFERLGCLSTNDNDETLFKLCSGKEYVYDSFIQALKTKISENIEVDNSNLSSNGGYYLSGNLILTNNNGFDIPGSAYKVEMGFIDSRKGIGVDKQRVNDFHPTIPANGSVSIQINYLPINGGNRVAGLVSLVDNQAISSLMNEAFVKTIGKMGLNCDNWDSKLSTLLYSL